MNEQQVKRLLQDAEPPKRVLVPLDTNIIIQRATKQRRTRSAVAGAIALVAVLLAPLAAGLAPWTLGPSDENRTEVPTNRKESFNGQPTLVAESDHHKESNLNHHELDDLMARSARLRASVASDVASSRRARTHEGLTDLDLAPLGGLALAAVFNETGNNAAARSELQRIATHFPDSHAASLALRQLESFDTDSESTNRKPHNEPISTGGPIDVDA